MPGKKKRPQIANYVHQSDTRKNIPTAEIEPVMGEDKRTAIRLEYERASRNKDLDPQFVWRGKDEQDQSDLVVTAPPIFIQEKVHPRVLIEDLIRQSDREMESGAEQPDLFADFNGLKDQDLKSEYYEHEQNWSNRMILGDSLQVMASLSSREGYQGKVQCIYIDPPYGIRFNSNFQWSTASRDVKDGNRNHITREPEQVKAFRDTWKHGIHSYLTSLRDRLTVAHDLLADSGSIFVQIGDENVHRVRALMDEVFGEANFVALISFRTHSPLGVKYIAKSFDYIAWYSKDYDALKYRQLYKEKQYGLETPFNYMEKPNGDRYRLKDQIDPSQGIEQGYNIFRLSTMSSSGYTPSCTFPFDFEGKKYELRARKSWRTNKVGMNRLVRSRRLYSTGSYLNYIQRHDDLRVMPINNNWGDVYTELAKQYVVQTGTTPIQRCILMTTDPGDLVLDPTCGSGTTAYVAEQWGRRWITIDTSRVALALARARLMGARYPYYLLADSPAGQRKETQLSRRAPSVTPTYGNVRQGFVYQRVPHITLRDIANNAEIDVIYEQFQEKMEPLRRELDQILETEFNEWEIPRGADESWTEHAQTLQQQWWGLRIARQKEVDAAIASQADFEFLYDKPYEDKSKVRVAGPFTVESLSPHRLLVSGDVNEAKATPADPQSKDGQHFEGTAPARDFASMIIENLRISGVQQSNKNDSIEFNSIVGWPGEYICAEGEYSELESQKRAGIFVGPEFGTVGQPDLTAAAREAGQAGFDVLISCAFSYDAHATEFNRLGALPVLKARMNADLHMDTDLKNTGQGNLFVIFGEPDIDVQENGDGNLQVKIRGVDIYDPSTGQVRSDDTDGIACWFIDTDYNEESFFVRQAYFLGANDPYKALKTTLKSEIDREAWESLNSDMSMPFPKPQSGRIAVKVINHLGDEAMKVIRV